MTLDRFSSVKSILLFAIATLALLLASGNAAAQTPSLSSAGSQHLYVKAPWANIAADASGDLTQACAEADTRLAVPLVELPPLVPGTRPRSCTAVEFTPESLHWRGFL